jgi:hypothetical protein
VVFLLPNAEARLSVDVERGHIAGLECMGSSSHNLLKIPADYFPPIHCPISKDVRYQVAFGVHQKVVTYISRHQVIKNPKIP